MPAFARLADWGVPSAAMRAYPESMRAEGWYQDPYHLHTDRWFSDGQPTDLVRDGRVESRDAPPDTPYPGPLVEAVEVPPVDGSDLRRADEAEEGRPPGTAQQIWAGIETAASGGLGPGGIPDFVPGPEAE
jgi:hypothetical protein